MPDITVEEALRSAFQAESDHLGITITAAELERRLVVRRRSRTGRRFQLLAAGIAIVAFVGLTAVSNGWLRAPAIGTTVSPSPSAASSTPEASLPATASQSPSSWVPPKLQASVSTLGQTGETLVVAADCGYDYALANGELGGGRCPFAPEAPCCESLDVPWGSDLTFTIPDGWSIVRSLIESTGMSWVDDRSAPSRTINGWSTLGDDVITFEGEYSKDGDTFTATFTIPVAGPAEEPAVAPPALTCGTPDLTSKTPPAVALIAGRTQRARAPDPVVGEFGTTAWGDTFSEAAGDPMPRDAVRIAAGAPLQLRIDGDVCANGWTIGYGPRGSPEYLSIDRVGSLVPIHRRRPTDPPALANRFDLAPLPVGEWYIEAVFHYADGDAWIGWHVIVE